MPSGKHKRDSRDSKGSRIFSGADLPGGPPRTGENTGLRGGLRLAGFQKESRPGLPLVTVVTVVLNEAETLERTIHSVLRQSYDNIELIVIDGGSTGPTLDIIRKYGDKIDYWLSEPDQGIFDAMNKGIALAGGEWINFLNCGDYFYRNDTVQSVFSRDYIDADFIYGHSDFQGGDFRGVVKAWDFGILWKTMIFTHQSLFSKSAILKKRPFNTDFRICADYDLIFNSWADGLKFHNSDTVIASFNPGFSDLSRARMAWEKWQVVRRHRNDLPFHFFYLRLFLKRWLRDIMFRLKNRLKTLDPS
jgi:glycosyltransferase involved in cell wall biosynthesis